MDKHTLKLLTARIGRTAVGASTAHNMGPAGTVKAAREFLQELDLRAFRVRTEAAFLKRLDAKTNDLAASLPPSAQHWGSARKFLNIFIRNCAYNRFVCEEFGLDALEPWTEVPLDSHVATGLKGEQEGAHLRRWESVVGLTRINSDALQAVALAVAKRKGINRVHLDVHYWNGPHTIKS
ncbi:hypothetical protein BZM26_10100 [Paraburkholderia strydomiana]|nr:hypothetical protein BZM26_10100 [Paraburkholderia strydomiana]